MKNAWNLLGTVAGYLGMAICVVAVAGRFYGAPAFLGFAASSVLLMGIASMVKWSSDSGHRRAVVQPPLSQ